MAQAPFLTNITMESLPEVSDELRPAFQNMVRLLNPFLSDTTQALGKNLNYGQNFNSDVKVVTVTIPDETWTDATLEHSWVLFNAAYYTPGYRITENGVVKLRGLAKNGSTTPGDSIFTLPIGYRPSKQLTYGQLINSGTTIGQVDVLANGMVAFEAGGGNSFVCLDGIEFEASALGPAAAPAAFDSGDWPILLAPLVTGKVTDCQLIKINDLSGTNSTSVGGYLPDWSIGTNGSVVIRRIGGLSPGRKYQLTFRILGE